MKNKYFSKYNIYFLIYTLFAAVFIENYHTIHFENQGFDAITRILHPEFPKGGLDYNPIFHYHYLVAFVAKIFNFNFDSPILPKIFWFVEPEARYFHPQTMQIPPNGRNYGLPHLKY